MCCCEHFGFTESISRSVEPDSETIPLKVHNQLDPGRDVLQGPLPLPDRAWMTHVQVVGMSGTAPTNVSWWLSSQADGSEPLTEIKSTAWVPPASGSGLGGVAQRIEMPWVSTPESRALYVCVGHDAGGPCVLRARVFWKIVNDLDLTAAHRARLALIEAARGCG